MLILQKILFTNEQSRKFQVHGKDINDKFGKAPLPTICLLLGMIHNDAHVITGRGGSV